MRISYSAFDTFTSCPLKYKFQYLDRVPIEKKIELLFGSLMHSVVESALKRDPIIPPLDDLINYYLTNFAALTFADELSKKQYHQVGLDMIKTFHRSLAPGLRDTIATEKRFQIPLNDKHTLTGVIDRIDKLPFGAIEVIDYKTNFKPKTQMEVDCDKQLGLYHFALGHLWPEVKDVRLTFYFLRSDQQLTTTRKKEDIESLIEEVIETAEKIENETEFKPKINPLCDWCDFKTQCPSRTDDSNAQINDLAERYIKTIKQEKELEAALHEQFDLKRIEEFSHRLGKIKRSPDKKIVLD